ncbi:MAG: hypothetical protein L0Y71_05000 [Gemmataceae bacterium]|nr:hypothetical protein [Gemmataceae bacterium]
MYKLPELAVPPIVTRLPEQAKELWLRALASQEMDLQIKAAGAIGRAHRRGFAGMDTTIAPLMTAFDKADVKAAARLAMARTLVALDARASAAKLLEHAQSGDSDLRNIVEPALVSWNHGPARTMWLQRLADSAASPRSLVLAIHALGALREEKAVERLRELALSAHILPPIRLEAAKALGNIRRDGLEKDAASLAEDQSADNRASRLIAMALVRQHRSRDAIEFMQRLTRDPEPAVAAEAAASLLQIDPDLVVASLGHLLAHADANLRSLAVDVLARRPSEPHIRLLADRLDDLDVETRLKARQALLRLAEMQALRGQVVAETARMLAKGQWRALEQAAIVLARLDHKPAAKRFVELQTHQRLEVRVATAWGLRNVAVPATLPEVTQLVDREWKRLSNPPASSRELEMVDHQLSQLIQFLGRQKHQPADPLLRRFIPKRGDLAEARSAAVWALGMIHEGKPAADLTKRLEGRLMDTTGIPPEDSRVRWMAAVALGRMNAKTALPSLRQQYTDGEPSLNMVNNACGWAIARITGEKMPKPKTIHRVERDWFLAQN